MLKSNNGLKTMKVTSKFKAGNRLCSQSIIDGDGGGAQGEGLRKC